MEFKHAHTLQTVLSVTHFFDMVYGELGKNIVEDRIRGRVCRLVGH